MDEGSSTWTDTRGRARAADGRPGQGKTRWVWFHKLGSPPHFYRLSRRLTPWLGGLTAVLLAVGTYWGLVVAPPDYQQGESYRIIFVHVPSAWMSLFCWMFMAGCAVGVLVWRTKVTAALMRNTAPLGATFTFLALATGALWGKPMWGTYWVWDARLTSELILLLLYLGFMGLQSAIEDRNLAARAGAVLALVGVVNIPIIHYSVEWWNTLHQGPTVTRFDSPAISLSMLLPLLVMAIAFMTYFATLVLKRTRCDILEMEGANRWAREWVPQSANEQR